MDPSQTLEAIRAEQIAFWGSKNARERLRAASVALDLLDELDEFLCNPRAELPLDWQN